MMMKHILKSAVVLLAIAIALMGCREIRDAELGEPFSKVEGLTETKWEITAVSIVDGADPAQASRDFGEFYLNGDSKLTLDFTDEGTFTVQTGDGLNFLPSDGIWTFDDPDFPTKIILNHDTDPQELQLEAPTRKVDQELKVRYDKYFCVLEEGEPEVPVYSYRLIFQRVNE